MYKNKYLKYKNKYLKLVGGDINTECSRTHHTDNNNRIDFTDVVLQNDLFLFHGTLNFADLNVSTQKDLGTRPDNPSILMKELKFFNTTHFPSISYALHSINVGYIGVYQVINPLKIYGTTGRSLFYNSKDEYSLTEAQCLCDEDYNGYCTGGLERTTGIKAICDIGLCNYYDKIRLIGYIQINNRHVQTNIKELNVYKYNDNDTIPNINYANLLKYNDIYPKRHIYDILVIYGHIRSEDEIVTIRGIELINRPNIDTIYDTSYIFL